MSFQGCNRAQYEDNPVLLPGIRQVQIDSEVYKNPQVKNVAVPTANTEVTYVLPAGTKRFSIKLRTPARLQLAYAVGTSGTEYLTIPYGVKYWEDGIDSTTTVTLYFQANVGSNVAELVIWS